MLLPPVNILAVAYLNNFGGTKSMKCNSKARDIWELAVSNRIWIIVTVGGSLWTGAERCKCFFHQLISSKHSFDNIILASKFHLFNLNASIFSLSKRLIA
jgi:hypothetical protein